MKFPFSPSPSLCVCVCGFCWRCGSVFQMQCFYLFLWLDRFFFFFFFFSCFFFGGRGQPFFAQQQLREESYLCVCV
ncbi:hypothetical protein TCDM_01289 [Trypanosoma cruzi Dm28c]|uniref:Uncharacterized protein n=1 Tax=Trypanosoma cruzi Dm28c TaxID=1416333 RepID=V5DR01_TRYCR|nr:hypothetical protein TCDM_01289 [Trypanosoma cruzi Dm28c]